MENNFNKNNVLACDKDSVFKTPILPAMFCALGAFMFVFSIVFFFIPDADIKMLRFMLNFMGIFFLIISLCFIVAGVISFLKYTEYSNHCKEVLKDAVPVNVEILDVSMKKVYKKYGSLKFFSITYRFELEGKTITKSTKHIFIQPQIDLFIKNGLTLFYSKNLDAALYVNQAIR